MRVKHFGKEEIEDLQKDAGKFYYGMPFSSADAGLITEPDEAGELYLTDSDIAFIKSSAAIVYDETDEDIEKDTDEDEVQTR